MTVDSFLVDCKRFARTEAADAINTLADKAAAAHLTIEAQIVRGSAVLIAEAASTAAATIAATQFPRLPFGISGDAKNAVANSTAQAFVNLQTQVEQRTPRWVVAGVVALRWLAAKVKPPAPVSIPGFPP